MITRKPRIKSVMSIQDPTNPIYYVDSVMCGVV